MQALSAEVDRFAPVDVPTLLIRGESGTGKELVAKAVQRLSDRRERPFETPNCANLMRDFLHQALTFQPGLASREADPGGWQP